MKEIVKLIFVLSIASVAFYYLYGKYIDIVNSKKPEKMSNNQKPILNEQLQSYIDFVSNSLYDIKSAGIREDDIIVLMPPTAIQLIGMYNISTVEELEDRIEISTIRVCGQPVTPNYEDTIVVYYKRWHIYPDKFPPFIMKIDRK